MKAASSAFILQTLLFPASLPAQDGNVPLHRFWLEGAVGVAVPTQDWGNVDPTCPDNNPTPCPFPMQIGASTGVGFAGRTGFRFDPKTTVFLGYTRSQFQCAEAFCGTAAPPLTASFDVGIQRDVAAFGNMRFWAEGAVSSEQVSVVRIGPNANLAFNERVAFDRAIAFSLGFGVRLGLRGNNTWEFAPAARYRFYSADPTALNSDLNGVDITHFHLDLAFRRNYF